VFYLYIFNLSGCSLTTYNKDLMMMILWC